jgi:hypothetical protein
VEFDVRYELLFEIDLQWDIHRQQAGVSEGISIDAPHGSRNQNSGNEYIRMREYIHAFFLKARDKIIMQEIDFHIDVWDSYVGIIIEVNWLH